MYQLRNLIFLFCLLIAFSCKKKECDEPQNTLDPNGLPPATMIGAETMGCLVNGVPWLPQKPAVFGDGNVYNVTWELTAEGVLNLSAVEEFQEEEVYNSMALAGFGFLSEGSYSENTICSFDIGSEAIEYISDSTNYKHINITKLDYQKGIFSGEFEFDLINEDNVLDTVKIREGRFDLMSN